MAKFIIILEVPTGGKFAFSIYKDPVLLRDIFALVPLLEDGSVKNAIAWNTREEAESHLGKQLDKAPELINTGKFHVHECLEPKDVTSH